MYEQAIERDPNYALAYAGIADANSLLFQWVESSPEIAAKANEASIRAVELDSDSAEAHAARGMALSLNKQYDDAEREFETAIILNPELFEAYYLYARDCFAQGKKEIAKVHLILDELFPSENVDVPDPYYGGDLGFENVFILLGCSE